MLAFKWAAGRLALVLLQLGVSGDSVSTGRSHWLWVNSAFVFTIAARVRLGL